MKMKFLIAASAAALIAGTSARAADIVHYQEAYVPAFSWTGLYGGADVGYAFGNGEIKNSGSKKKKDDAGKAEPSTFVSLAKKDKKKKKQKVKPSGIIGGFYGGYNYGFSDRIIIGADTDFTFSDASKKKKIGSIRQRWSGATRLRAGYAFNRFLPYLAVGVAYTDVKTSVAGAKSANKTRTGWTIGGGVDYALTNHVILRGEYRYNDYGNKKTKFGDAKYKIKYNQSDVRVGVAYKF